MRKVLAAVLVSALGVGAAGLGAGTAGATGSLLDRTLSQTDKGRLAAFEETRRTAIAAARKGGEAGEVEVLDKILSGEPQPILGEDLRGTYRCRTIKMDGILPLVVYDWFQCRIDEDDLGYRLVKTSGSQRLSGHFVDDAETRLAYYGAGHYSDEKPKAYGADPERDEVGYLFKVGAKRYRLEFPLPKLESRFDILELERR